MTNERIIQNAIARLGQSQRDRLAPELDVHFADVDERTTEDFLLWTEVFAEYVNFYRDDPFAPTGDWQNFFPKESEITTLLNSNDANIQPHLALFLTFLELYKIPREVINRFTGRHLDFYYKDVLQLKKKGSVPDKVHVLVELKKNAALTLITPDHLLSAGKDRTGVELLYKPTEKTIINNAKVDSLRSLFIDDNGTVHYAPIANSANGLGNPLSEEEPKWYGFGHPKLPLYPELPLAEVGFAIAAPVLRLKEGQRKIIVTLSVSNPENLTNQLLQEAFEVFLTGEKTWLGPYLISPTIENSRLTFTLELPITEKAIVDYSSVVHGYAYTAQAPVMQVLLKTGGTGITYSNFKNVLLQKAKVAVAVSNIVSLHLESDAGVLDAKKPFLPFGVQPVAGARFLVSYSEALDKKLSQVTLTLKWKDAPTDFSTHYQDYAIASIGNRYFTAAVAFEDARDQKFSSSSELLFDSKNPSGSHEMTFEVPSKASPTSPSKPITTGTIVNALYTTDLKWGLIAAEQYVLRNPWLKSFQTTVLDEQKNFKIVVPEVQKKGIAPEFRQGFITLVLQQGFEHSTYRKKYVEQVMTYSKSGTNGLTLINEPYTPTIQNISLGYKAESDEVAIASSKLSDFANNDLQFFHITYFGQMREHGYQRQQFQETVDTTITTTIPLLPTYSYIGELLLGLNQLHPGDSVSVLFQVAEGSADPELDQEEIDWFVLCDNYWKRLSRNEVVLDTTNHLLTSGIIKFLIPREATTTHTILPNDRIWLKAAIANNVQAVCQLIEVAANAVEAEFVDQGNDPEHLLEALGKGKITKLKNGLVAVKSIKQPYASFGGGAVETDSWFYTRVSERLRHKNRCITGWDYERIVLEAFPKVHRVKCISHAKEDSWLSPGYVLLVVIPDLKNQYAVDRLRPKVGANTIKYIKTYVKKRIGMQVQVEVKNPRYQEIQLDFKVKFQPDDFNYYVTRLQKDVTQFLSPWAYSAEREPTFGGKVYKSLLLDFVEDLDYVDYVTDFKMYSYSGSTQSTLDLNEVQPETPDTILVSTPTHRISPVSTSLVDQV